MNTIGSRQPDKFDFVKQYRGKHAIFYEGLYYGNRAECINNYAEKMEG